MSVILNLRNQNQFKNKNSLYAGILNQIDSVCPGDHNPHLNRTRTYKVGTMFYKETSKNASITSTKNAKMKTIEEM